jgi:two-component system phosphate regulon sensor histidine kinase PhoR
METIIDRTKWFFHPVLVFVFSILALAASLALYIYWYVEVSTGLREVVESHNLDPGQFLESETWVVVLILSILVGIILVGILIIFIYNQKTQQLYRMQYNFINNFTHELKTPVTSLKLYLETFMKHEISRRDQTRYLGYMVQDVERLSENINRILNLAKIESKSHGGEFVESNLISAVEQLLQNNSRLFENCEINIHNPAGLNFDYRINEPLFDMLLMNLLVNAVKYNESEKPKIDITFELLKYKLYIRFADNGIGIEKKEIKKIFKKFYQTGRVDDMTAKGSGLGLHLARSVVRLHHGKVEAQSEGKGRGSEFILTLPYKTWAWIGL